MVGDVVTAPNKYLPDALGEMGNDDIISGGRVSGGQLIMGFFYKKTRWQGERERGEEEEATSVLLRLGRWSGNDTYEKDGI